MYSITLQTNDNVVTSGERLGQIQFAASSESDGSAAIDIAGSVFCQAEGSFQSASNPTSIVLATAAADASAAVGRIKVTDNGHLVPVAADSYDLGDTTLRFRDVHASGGVFLSDTTPSVTTNKLYNEGGTLKFNGSAVGGGGGISNIVEDTTPQLGGDLDLNGNQILDCVTEASAAGNTSLTVLAATSQTATIQEWQNSATTKLLAVGPDGGLEIPSNTPSTTTNKLFYDGSTLRWDANDIIDSSMIGAGLQWQPLANTLAIGEITTSEFAASTLVIESEGIASNDNDTTIPTSAAVRDYVDTQDAAISGYAEAISGGGGTPGGADTNVQYNNAGSFGGESDFTYNATTNTLTVPTGKFDIINFTNSDSNIYIGNSVSKTSQDFNIFIGQTAGSTNLFAGNIAMGYRSMNANGSSFTSYNTCIGYQTMYASKGNRGVAIGYEAMRGCGATNLITNNVGIGQRALAAIDGDNNIEIVTNYGSSNNTGMGTTVSDRLNIGHTIFGNTSDRKIRIGMSGVITSFDTAPDATLEVLPEATTDLVLLAKGTNGQTGNLFECRDASDTSLVSVDSNGKLYPAKGLRTNWLSSSGGGASKDFNLNDSAAFSHTLDNATTTLSVSNGGAGSRFTVALAQDATGGREVTWWSNIKWPGGLEPTLTTTANKVDIFGFIEHSAGNYYGFVIGYNL